MKFTLLLLLLVGCGSFSDVKESIKTTETLDASLQTSDKGTNSYSGDPLDQVHVVASGNSSVLLTIGDKGHVEKGEKRDTATEEEIEASFSVDYYIRSIPTTGWALLVLTLCLLLAGVWWFLKTTMIGKAMDASVAKGLELIGENIDLVRDKLSDATKGTEIHSELQVELARLMKQQGDFKHQAKRRR